MISRLNFFRCCKWTNIRSNPSDQCLLHSTSGIVRSCTRVSIMASWFSVSFFSPKIYVFSSWLQHVHICSAHFKYSILFIRTFSFCQYPFVLSLRAKRFIMQKDSETKMLLEARVCTKNRKNVPSLLLILSFCSLKYFFGGRFYL